MWWKATNLRMHRICCPAPHASLKVSRLWFLDLRKNHLQRLVPRQERKSEIGFSDLEAWWWLCVGWETEFNKLCLCRLCYHAKKKKVFMHEYTSSIEFALSLAGFYFLFVSLFSVKKVNTDWKRLWRSVIRLPYPGSKVFILP